MKVDKEMLQDRLQEIKKSWEDDMVAGNTFCDFLDFEPYKNEIDKFIKENNIKCEIEYLSIGMSIEYGKRG